MSRREFAALATLLVILVITVVWWALALWPLPADAAWLARARLVCFGSSDTGLPDPAGWLALTLQPAILLGIHGAVWGGATAGAIGAISRCRIGRAALAGVALLLVTAGGGAGWRISTASALAGQAAASPAGAVTPLGRDAPPLDLVNQDGDTVTLAQFRGRPVLITFAFAHCETVCPLVVRDVLDAQEQLADLDPVAIVVTLDPWRDLPSRLPHIARQWQLGPDAHVLSGSVARVQDVLDRWRVGRRRDPTTGDLIHSRLVYVLDGAGRIAYAVSAGTEQIVDVARTLAAG